MMDLISIENASEFPIRGRELHEQLGIETRYNDWFKRMCEYGFEAGKDFETVLKKEYRADGAMMPQQSAHHQLTISMAKELCMLQRTDKGREVRRHLIRVEEQWNQPDAVIARALQMAARKMEKLTGNLLHLEATNMALNARIETDAPRVHFAESVEGSDSSMLIGTLAKLIRQSGGDTGEKRLFEQMRREGFLCSEGARRNLPTQRAMDMKLFEVVEHIHTTPDGRSFVTVTTKVTGKGQVYFMNRYASGQA
jgi:anti-repressor protein